MSMPRKPAADTWTTLCYLLFIQPERARGVSSLRAYRAHCACRCLLQLERCGLSVWHRLLRLFLCCGCGLERQMATCSCHTSLSALVCGLPAVLYGLISRTTYQDMQAALVQSGRRGEQ